MTFGDTKKGENSMIFGYEWEDVKKMQQGTFTPQKATGGRPKATKDDYVLLNQYGGMNGLEKAGLHGVIDRLNNPDNDQPKSNTDL